MVGVIWLFASFFSLRDIHFGFMSIVFLYKAATETYWALAVSHIVLLGTCCQSYCFTGHLLSVIFFSGHLLSVILFYWALLSAILFYWALAVSHIVLLGTCCQSYCFTWHFKGLKPKPFISK